ncbi:MAG: hypothetical protein ACE3L7_01470 [Candidatus Pristimantibacillus sp.]
MIIIDSDLNSPINKGGTLLHKKEQYKIDCDAADVKFVMSLEHRCIENMYPKEVLANVLGVTVYFLKYSTYDVVPGINDKIKIDKLVAEHMTLEQAKDFPQIREIEQWWSTVRP